MSVYRPKGSKFYVYDFEYRKERYKQSTGQRTKKAAEKVEARVRERVEHQVAGIAIPSAEDSYSFMQWADVYRAHVQADPTITRPERIEDLLRVVLRFWGAKHKDLLPTRDGEVAPFHDLRLLDPILDPGWLSKFAAWVQARGVAGHTASQYVSTLSQMYELARHRDYRKRTGITQNPFDGEPRDKGNRSTVVLTPAQTRAILAAASYHVRLAVAIAALAPKLRRSNVLQLQWRVHLDDALEWITVTKHKTAERTGKPLVVPITAQLRRILQDARRRQPTSTFVVTYRGKPLKDIRNGLENAMREAGVAYGRYGGATFHTLRHSAATLLAALEVPREQRKDVMGHENMATTDWYTHLRPTVEIPVLEQLSTALPIDDLVTAPGGRVGKRAKVDGGKNGGAPSPRLSETLENTRRNPTAPRGAQL